MPKISIIVPVYNVENYLTDCVNSIIEQSYHDYELILVDDGSTDCSGELCDKLSRDNDKIKVLHQKNSGAAAARNYAMSRALGEYFTFIDSDDLVAPDYLMHLVTILEQYHGDIAACSVHKFVSHYTPSVRPDDTSQVHCYTGIEAAKLLLYRRGLDSYCCGKLYRRECFSQTKIDANELFEDLGTTYKLYLDSNTIVVDNRYAPYYYRQHKNSLINSKFTEKRMQLITRCLEVEQYLTKHYPMLLPAAYSKTFLGSIETYVRIPYGAEYKSYKKQCLEQIRRLRRNNLSNSENRASTRLMALIAIICVPLLRFIGKFYLAVKNCFSLQPL